ncbi:MAG: hypothetical protein WC620_03905 [Methanoregula sp.]|jgi:hypothetical protein
MADIESLYKKVDDKILIEIKLSSVMQLFNSFDPAPFHEKELDTAAEHYTIDTVKDFPANTKFKMVIYVPKELAESEQAHKIKPAIQYHFKFRMMGADRKFRSHFRYGRSTMLIGLSFLAITLFARQMISTISHDLAAQIVADALLIIGWVAMWEPVTGLLYELWPIIQTKKVYQKISEMEIEIVPSS